MQREATQMLIESRKNGQSVTCALKLSTTEQNH